MALIDLSKIPYLEAKYHGGVRTETRFLVIHDMESHEKPSSAEEWMNATHNATRESSVHFGVDSDTICCAVQSHLVAWHAGGGNSDTIGTEHAGFASQTRSQWLDAYGTAMLKLSARLQATLCLQYDILPRRATADDYVNAQTGKPFQTGILGHIDITTAAQRLGRSNAGHYDPGPNFPWDTFIQWVQDAYNEEKDAVMGVTKKELEAMIERIIDERIDTLADRIPTLLNEANQRARMRLATSFGKDNQHDALIEAARLGNIAAKP